MDTHSSEIQKFYEQLTKCLDDIIRIYSVLTENLQAERQILIESNIEKLQESNEAKEKILLKLGTLENIRIKLARGLAQLIGANAESPRLLEIASRLPLSMGEKLKDQHKVLDLQIRRVNELNRDNEELVQAALRHVQGAMEFLRQSLVDNKVYKKEGSVNKNPQAGRLVSREA